LLRQICNGVELVRAQATRLEQLVAELDRTRGVTGVGSQHGQRKLSVQLVGTLEDRDGPFELDAERIAVTRILVDFYETPVRLAVPRGALADLFVGLDSRLGVAQLISMNVGDSTHDSAPAGEVLFHVDQRQLQVRDALSAGHALLGPQSVQPKRQIGGRWIVEQRPFVDRGSRIEVAGSSERIARIASE